MTEVQPSSHASNASYVPIAMCVQVEEVGGGFDSSLYTCSLLWAQVRGSWLATRKATLLCFPAASQSCPNRLAMRKAKAAVHSWLGQPITAVTEAEAGTLTLLRSRASSAWHVHCMLCCTQLHALQPLWLCLQSADGTQVPISLAYRRDLMRRDGSNPCVMHAYGAYGSRQVCCLGR
jgi:hypothetical protein